MGERLTRLRFHSEGWWVRSCDKHLVDSGPHDRIAIGREGYVIATVIPRGDEEPEVHFCGMRPFREDRAAFWELTELACNFAKIMKGSPT